MATKEDLSGWLIENNYENELRRSGDLFFTWQYDIRWVATQLRNKGILRAAESSPSGIWELAI
jgi:hypothetical protein